MKKILILSSLAIIATLSTAFPVGECPPPGPGGVNLRCLLADDRNCNQFYDCFYGVPILMECPDYLLFNDELDVCDWPRAVDCNRGGTNDSTDRDKYLACVSNGGTYDMRYDLTYTETIMKRDSTGAVYIERCETRECTFTQGSCCTQERSKKCETIK